MVGLFIFAAIVVFAAIAYQLGSLRLDLARYALYTVRFTDASGLVHKSDVKISGVKVGWVDSIHLVSRDMTVHVTLKIPKDYQLYRDAKASLRQEGLLGSKYLEIVPGNSQTGIIPPGGSLLLQLDTSVQMDEVYDTFRTISKRVESLSTALQDTAKEVSSLVQSVNERLSSIDIESVASTINTVTQTLAEVKAPIERITKQIGGGKGSLGKLLTDDTLYQDIKSTSDYARGCIERIRGCSVDLDSYLEILPHHHTNVKWHFDASISPCAPFYGLIGLTYSRDGFSRSFQTRCGDTLFCCTKEKRDALRLNLQVGGFYNRFRARVGLIEGTAGVGIDFWIARNCFQWLTTFEAYDFKGNNRFDRDCRAHLKWLNKLYFNSSVYLTAGADDFISKCQRSAFVGLGAHFSTGDLFCGC